MAKSNSTQAASVLRNGCEALTRDGVVCDSCIAMNEAEKLRIIFVTIARLEANGEIQDLANMGKGIADGLHNDLDVLRERAEMAGLIGELTPKQRKETRPAAPEVAHG